MQMKKSWYRNPKIIVTIFSVILMTISAIVSYGLIKKNYDKIANLHAKVKSKQEIIDNVWQSSISLEAKVDNAVLVTLLSRSHKKDYSKIVEHYTNSNENTIEDLVNMLQEVNDDRDRAIATINNLYNEKITAEVEIMDRSSQNKLYTTVAIFLQLISVIIAMLARDIHISI